MLIDPANAELDLPQGPTRKVRSGGSSISPPQVQGAAASGTPATDLELLQYIEQARLRHFGQMVGKGIGMISHASGKPARQPLAQSFMSMLADPTGSWRGRIPHSNDEGHAGSEGPERRNLSAGLGGLEASAGDAGV